MGRDSHQDAVNGRRSAETSRHDGEEYKTATIAVVDAVSAVSGTDPTELPPLYDAVDPDALNSLFETHANRDDDPSIHVEFSYSGFDITVKDGLRVTVQER